MTKISHPRCRYHCLARYCLKLFGTDAFIFFYQKRRTDADKFKSTQRIYSVCFGEGCMSYKCSHPVLTVINDNTSSFVSTWKFDSRQLSDTRCSDTLLDQHKAPIVLFGTSLVYIQDTVRNCRILRALINLTSQCNKVCLLLPFEITAIKLRCQVKGF